MRAGTILKSKVRIAKRHTLISQQEQTSPKPQPLRRREVERPSSPFLSNTAPSLVLKKNTALGLSGPLRGPGAHRAAALFLHLPHAASTPARPTTWHHGQTALWIRPSLGRPSGTKIQPVFQARLETLGQKPRLLVRLVAGARECRPGCFSTADLCFSPFWRPGVRGRGSGRFSDW